MSASMTHSLFVAVLAALLLGAPHAATAQGEVKQPPAKQSAPSESSHAPGHDAQSGKPDTGEKKPDFSKEKDSARNPPATPPEKK